MLQRKFSGSFMFPVSGRVSSPFGYRHHPVTGTYKLHTGVDISCRTGTSVRAAADGVVSKACYNRAYGYMVIIQHNGGYSTLYGHNSRLLVCGGQQVKQGQIIAKSGSTGWSTGPHCHFQLMKNGSPINPGRP
jgi:murein DD-endopeptidase MepM/ murein hydrolase activator NlpD